MDKRLESIQKGEDTLCKDHKMYCIEVPLLANGLEAHPDNSCVVCYMSPIIGGCFTCQQCPSFAACQNCYFTKQETLQTKKYRGHENTHQLTLTLKCQSQMAKLVKCMGCQKTPIVGVRYRCSNCFNFDLCEECFLQHTENGQDIKPDFKNEHHRSHKFFKLEMKAVQKEQKAEEGVPRSTLAKKKKGR